MKITVLGTGAIGSLFAAWLSAVPTNEVLCVTRTAEHAREINDHGITIAEPDGSETRFTNLRAVTDTTGEDPADLVIVLVKSYCTQRAVSGHPQIFGPDTTALTLQNGYGNHEPLRAVLDDRQILLGTTAHGAYIREDGVIVHAGSGITRIGALTGSEENAPGRAGTTVKVLCRAGFTMEISVDATDTVFRKLLINTGINALSALHNTTNRHIVEDPEMERAARGLVDEAVDVLALYGYKYNKEEIWKDVAGVARRTGDNVCSMLADVRAGRQTEIQSINGALVRLAEAKGGDAPLNRAVTARVEALRT